MFCKHKSVRYCRVQTLKGHIFFSKQCCGCLELVKSPENGDKLFLKQSDIPLEATIYPFVHTEAEGASND